MINALSSSAAVRRLALALAALLTVLVALTWHGGSASADTAYPPPPPCTSSQSGGTAVNPSCGVEPIQVVRTPSQSATNTTRTHHDSNLASTGFQTATAIAVVVVLFAAGGLFLYAGSRRRHG